jgi:hypothetical protein
MIDPFARSVTNLTGQVRSFQANLEREDAATLARDAGTCETVLKQLCTRVEQQRVDLNDHYTQLVTITGSLQHAKSDIRQKIEKASWDERPIWMGSLSSVNAALRLASSLAQQALGRRKFA